MSKLAGKANQDSLYVKVLELAGYMIIAMVILGVGVSVAYAPPTPPQIIETSGDPGLFHDGRHQGDTYAVTSTAGLQYLCAAYDVTDAGPDDPCVYNPDPEGDPVAVEPDNDPVPRWTLGVHERVSVLGGLVPAAFVTTYPAPPGSAGRDEARDVSVGKITEDDPRFDCRTMGNGVCGPGADHPAGCYVRKGKRAGVLLRRWDQAMAADLHYRPDGCGVRTTRDKRMDRALSASA